MESFVATAHGDGALNGKAQTAQRAEVRAVWEALQEVQGHMCLCSDRRYVVDTLQTHEGEAARAGTSRLDLWKGIREQRQCIVEATRILGTSHMWRCSSTRMG